MEGLDRRITGLEQSITTEVSAKVILLESRMSWMEGQQRRLLHQSKPNLQPQPQPQPHPQPQPQPAALRMFPAAVATGGGYSLTPSITAPSELSHGGYPHRDVESFQTVAQHNLSGLQVLDGSIAKLEMSMRSDRDRTDRIHSPPPGSPSHSHSFLPPSSSSPKRPQSRVFPGGSGT